MEALDDGGGLVSRGPDRRQAVLGQCRDQAFAAHHEDRGTRGDELGNQPGRRLRGRDDVAVRRVDAQVAQVLGHRGGRPGRVVGDEAESSARRSARGQAVGDPGQRMRTGVDDTVEVKQDQVVLGAEWARGRAQRTRDSDARMHGGQPRMRR